jgi:hypothetical protein
MLESLGEIIVRIGFPCDWVFGFGSVLLVLFNSIRMRFCQKPGSRLHASVEGLLLFLPSRLTEEGRRARRNVFIGLLGFVLSILVALCLRWINGKATID